MVHTVYGCQVVVTNPTSSRQKLTVLLQLPVGSIALNNGQFTSSILVNLEPYRTQTIDYFFYFPMAGKFKHFLFMLPRMKSMSHLPSPLNLMFLQSLANLMPLLGIMFPSRARTKKCLIFLNEKMSARLIF